MIAKDNKLFSILNINFMIIFAKSRLNEVARRIKPNI